ncbi:hypothetical protein Y032_0219g2444 [Ancylostoma ceylanicum]|uniref:Uncharacterized protein n=1 Tax=Ancylostoma ceylanicum TaxID=53326 RepID=A0A016SJB4_9BILA|nr:hypothetical protein Y032_0219g2444 [Ancylostoma ceylanicum]
MKLWNQVWFAYKSVTASRQHKNEVSHSAFADRLSLGAIRPAIATGSDSDAASVWSPCPSTLLRTQTDGRSLRGLLTNTKKLSVSASKPSFSDLSIVTGGPANLMNIDAIDTEG